MCSSIGRYLIAKMQIDYAREVNASALAHGATCKGNDQFRFEYTYASLAPDLEVIVPWRTWDFQSRGDLLNYAKQHKLEIENTSQVNHKPLSIDRNIAQISYEGEELENLNCPLRDGAWELTDEISRANINGTDMELEFKDNHLVRVDDIHSDDVSMFNHINKVAARNAIGRVDIVESRVMGMKSRNIYEVPAMKVISQAHWSISTLCLDREVLLLRQELIPKYARMIYDGCWFSPERAMLQAAFDQNSKFINGTIGLHLQQGNIFVVKRESNSGIFDQKLASFDSSDELTHTMVSGFIASNSLRLKINQKRL